MHSNAMESPLRRILKKGLLYFCQERDLYHDGNTCVNER